ncbi:MAG: phage tail assembly chaperone [Pseudomonadota bacterium]
MNSDAEPTCPQSQFPWPEMIKMASRIGIVPSCFWQLSLKEWAALVSNSSNQSSAMTRADFEKLSARFDDEIKKETYD